MYIPKRYLTENRHEIIAFMKQYSFATIVTVKDNFQTATHLPFTITEQGETLLLTSHFARANKQWEEVLCNQVLVIFNEPHAYISPGFYDSKLSVPTWNYIAVHAYGVGEIITDQDKAFQTLETMIDSYEAAYKTQWEQLPADFKNKMLKGIVPFQITVTELQAKKKLSQNKTEEERQRIIDAFSASTNENEKQIATYMQQMH